MRQAPHRLHRRHAVVAGAFAGVVAGLLIRGVLSFHDLATTDEAGRSLAPIGAWLVGGGAAKSDGGLVATGLIVHLLLAACIGAILGALMYRLSAVPTALIGVAAAALAYYGVGYFLLRVPGASPRPHVVMACSRLGFGALFALGFLLLYPGLARGRSGLGAPRRW
jgi:hypothetical protein